MENPTTETNIHVPFGHFWESLNVKDFGVYRLYDAQDRLLYVGMTCVLRSRMKQHYAEAGWMTQAARLDFEHGLTKTEASIRESEYIKELKPIHNKVVPLSKGSGSRKRYIPRKHHLPDEARRELTLRALAGESPTQLAREYGVTRSRVYQVMDEAREADHETRIAEAEAEAAFWRKIGERV